MLDRIIDQAVCPESDIQNHEFKTQTKDFLTDILRQGARRRSPSRSKTKSNNTSPPERRSKTTRAGKPSFATVTCPSEKS
jgi:hypothetical protein